MVRPKFPECLFYLWAKTDREGGSAWHPLLLHILDVAASAEAILAREPESTRLRMAQVLGLEWREAKPWLLLIIACHDLGKASPSFQKKWVDGHSDLMKKAGLSIHPGADTSQNHAFISQISLAKLLKERDWPEEMADLVADAVGCHHGERISPRKLDLLAGDRNSLGGVDWESARSQIFQILLGIFNPQTTFTKSSLSGPDFMLLAGLTSFADWIGSNMEFFPFGDPADCLDLKGWWQRRCDLAEHALDSVGWFARKALISEPTTFTDIFHFPSRPLQRSISDVVKKVSEPCVLLVEAPMGEGKTEGAFYAHLELQRRLGHRGLYVALPTKATGNAMFERLLTFLNSFAVNRSLDLQLVHGASMLNDEFQNIRKKLGSIHDLDSDGGVQASEWFSNKKRALLSEYGVGTVDQALMPILPVRHNFVRLWGLANRVIIFDEIHAYDAYTGTLLIQLIHWLNHLGSSVILLSATVSPSFRRQLAGKMSGDLPEIEASYPRLTLFRNGSVEQVSFDADPSRRIDICLRGVSPNLESLHDAVLNGLSQGGMALVLVNTVQRAQDLYQLFKTGNQLKHKGALVGKRLPDDTEVYLFHARYPADIRQKREEAVLDLFGKAGVREGRKILIATQVAEQSLDLDFDLIVTDLAPIDLLLQRAGRLWRHARAIRAVEAPVLVIAGLEGEKPPDFGKPLWWEAVYREDILLRTWLLLHGRMRQNILLPDEIDLLVRQVYEDEVVIPNVLQKRMDLAIEKGEGGAYAAKGQANFAHIGFPDDASWNESGRFVKADDDEPGVHPTLIAQTRLGEQSLTAIPIRNPDLFDRKKEPEFGQAKNLFLQGMSLSRKGVIKKLQTQGVPEGWKKSSLLRNCYALELNDDERWIEDTSVRLDGELGLVYEAKEKA